MLLANSYRKQTASQHCPG